MVPIIDSLVVTKSLKCGFCSIALVCNGSFLNALLVAWPAVQACYLSDTRPEMLLSVLSVEQSC